MAKTFLESFFQKCYPVFIGNHNLLFSFHTAITILPNGGIEAMDTTEGLQKNILDATLRVFDKKGLKFTMDDLAKELSISKKTIYTVYDDKEALFLAMVDYIFDSIKESEQMILTDPSLSVVEKLHNGFYLPLFCSFPI